MADRVNFVEVEQEEQCCYCGRKKLNENDKFYRVLLGDNPTDWIVCELCKGGFSTNYLEDREKTYATHLTFYLKRSLSELKGSLPENVTSKLESAIDNYEIGGYQASFRCIGLVAEWLTDKFFTEKYGESAENEKLTWETKLGRLLELSRKNKNAPGRGDAASTLFSKMV